MQDSSKVALMDPVFEHRALSDLLKLVHNFFVGKEDRLLTTRQLSRLALEVAGPQLEVFKVPRI